MPTGNCYISTHDPCEPHCFFEDGTYASTVCQRIKAGGGRSLTSKWSIKRRKMHHRPIIIDGAFWACLSTY